MSLRDLARSVQAQTEAFDARAARGLTVLAAHDAREALRLVQDLVDSQGGTCVNVSAIVQSTIRTVEKKRAQRAKQEAAHEQRTPGTVPAYPPWGDARRCDEEGMPLRTDGLWSTDLTRARHAGDLVRINESLAELGCIWWGLPQSAERGDACIQHPSLGTLTSSSERLLQDSRTDRLWRRVCKCINSTIIPIYIHIFPI